MPPSHLLPSPLHHIIQGDCLDVMRGLQDACVDLIVTSPPYNLKNSTGNGMKDGRGGKWANAALIKGYVFFPFLLALQLALMALFFDLKG